MQEFEVFKLGMLHFLALVGEAEMVFLVVGWHVNGFLAIGALYGNLSVSRNAGIFFYKWI